MERSGGEPSKTEASDSCFICDKKFSSDRELASHLVDHSNEEKFRVLIDELNSRIEKGKTPTLLFHEQTQNRREYVRRNYASKLPGRKQLSATSVEPEVVDILSDDEPNNNESDTKKVKLSAELPVKPAASSASNPSNPPLGTSPSFHCSTCKSVFNDALSLQKHMSIHNAARPFMCHICQKGFPYKGTLRQHLRMHISERSHECRFCPKKFTMKSFLRKHEEQHEMQHHSEFKKK